MSLAFYSSFTSFLWVFSMFMLVWWVGLKVLNIGNCSVVDFDFGDSLGFMLNGTAVLDFTCLVFSCTVLFVSAWILLYCGFYMSHEKFIGRFIGLMVLFVLSMNFLVLFPSLLFMMVGWDGLGVTSFLLVVYYSNYKSLSAGMITAITNRVGDAMFIFFVGVAGCFYGYDYYFMSMVNISLVMMFLLLVGSMTKSAQVPFSAWLPAAMAAPTPVSSLVHSSTLVTAGVYVLVRFSSIFNSLVYFVLLIFSMMTVVMAGLGAMAETDMKKVIALSTLSQVGVMMLCLGLGLVDLALFHLLAHAFFKALMFMCVGSVIFISGGIQDARFLGGLWFKSPVVFSWLMVCMLSLTGVPFLSGFYSKDLIMEEWLGGSLSAVSVLMLGFSLYLTSFYTVRMVVLLSRYDESAVCRGYEEKDPFLLSSLFGMGFGAFWGGYFLQKTVLCFNDFVYMSAFDKVFLLSGVFLGFGFFLLLTLLYFGLASDLSKELVAVKGFMAKMWFLPLLSGNFLSSVFLYCCSEVVSKLEKGWVSFIIFSVVQGLGEGSKVTRKSQLNSVGVLMMIGLGFVGLVVWL